MAQIIVIATGGVRAPSALEVLDRFAGDGHDVRLLATGPALRFMIWPLLSSPASLRLFFRSFRPQLRETLAYFLYRKIGVPHVEEGKWCDLAVVVPASSNSLGKLVAGLADNYPILVARGVPRSKRVLVIPSMNPEMWLDPFVQRNIDELNATQKYRVLCPSAGEMASGDFGIGAQVSMETIINESYRALGLIDPLLEEAAQPATQVTISGPKVPTKQPVIVVIDEDRHLRDMLCEKLESALPSVDVIGFTDQPEAVSWLMGNPASLILSALEFSDGNSGRDLIDVSRDSAADTPAQVILMGQQSRVEAGAEQLALQDVHYLPKPVNVPYVVGMVAGLIQASTVIQHGSNMTLAAGDVLFRDGDPGNEIYYLISGKMKVTIARPNQADKQVQIEQGEIVGELAFVTGEPRSATVTAITECNLLRIETSDFADYLARQPRWLRRIMDTLVERIKRADQNK